MFIIVDSKNKALDIKAHEEMVCTSELYYNPELNKWAIRVSSESDYNTAHFGQLGEGWICQS